MTPDDQRRSPGDSRASGDDNSAPKRKKGPGRPPKMTEEQFYEMMHAGAEKRTNKEWAHRFGVCISTIDHIISGQTKAFPWIRWGERIPFEYLPRENFHENWPKRAEVSEETIEGFKACDPSETNKMLADRFGLAEWQVDYARKISPHLFTRDGE